MLSREMFKQDYCLFDYATRESYLLTINPLSSVNQDHLAYFRFVGRVMGMAILHQTFLDGAFVWGGVCGKSIRGIRGEKDVCYDTCMYVYDYRYSMMIDVCFDYGYVMIMDIYYDHVCMYVCMYVMIMGTI